MSDRISSPRTDVLLSVDVPPVDEQIKQLLLRCGHTIVEVRRDTKIGGWRAWRDGHFVTDPRGDDYDAAVEDARRWAHNAERKRLLANRLDEVLQHLVAADNAAWRGRARCRTCDLPVCAVGAEDPCPGCCECLDRCIGEVPGDRPCPECSALPYRPHEADCPTLVPVVVNEDGSSATLDDLVGGENRGN